MASFFLPTSVFFPRKVFKPVAPLSHVLVNKHLGVSVSSKTNGLGKIWLGSSVSTHGEKVKEYEKVEALAKSRIPSSTERGGSHYESHARWNKFFDYALKTRFGESGYFTFEEASQEDLRDDMIFYFELEGVKEFCSIRCAYKGIKLTVHGMKKVTLSKNYYDILTEVDEEKKKLEEKKKEEKKRLEEKEKEEKRD